MGVKKIHVGFIGAGGIARSHAFAINSLKYYYNDSPLTEFTAVTSVKEKSRNTFASQFGFSKAVAIEDFVSDTSIDTVYILGPNKVHFEHLEKALKMPFVKRVYIEKPVCSTVNEETQMTRLIGDNPDVRIQSGFQYLFMPAIREALDFWNTGKLGRPLHFDLRYYHGDYLQREYRDKRATRLTPAPDGGAMADLGSHALSLLIAFLGDKLRISNAIQAGNFSDVVEDSDLFSLITIYDNTTHAAGVVSASRISSGTGDMLSLELFAENGSIRFSSHCPDYFEYFLEETGSWCRIMTGSNFKPFTSFPSGHVPPGWLRSMIHAHYIFLIGNETEPVIPDLTHGLAVQRLVRETAEHLKIFRNAIKTGFKGQNLLF